MSWSTQHSHQIVEQFWQNGVIKCPDDNGPLKLKLRKLHAGDYELRAECLVCGKRKELRRGDDPSRHTFRRWTIDEVQELKESTAKIGVSPCPVCSTYVEWQAAPSVLLLRCFRCGNSNQWVEIAAQKRNADLCVSGLGTSRLRLGQHAAPQVTEGGRR